MKSFEITVEAQLYLPLSSIGFISEEADRLQLSYYLDVGPQLGCSGKKLTVGKIRMSVSNWSTLANSADVEHLVDKLLYDITATGDEQSELDDFVKDALDRSSAGRVDRNLGIAQATFTDSDDAMFLKLKYHD